MGGVIINGQHKSSTVLFSLGGSQASRQNRWLHEGERSLQIQ